MEENIITRVKPNSLEAEQSLVGALFVDSDAASEVMTIIKPYDFYHKAYRLIYEAIIELRDTGKATDIVTVQDALKAKGAPEDICTISFLGDLARAVPTAANAGQYAQIIKEKSLLRAIIDINEKIADECYAGKKTTDEILEDTEKKIFSLIQKSGPKDGIFLKDALTKSIEKISETYANKGSISGIPTGYDDIDSCLLGLQPSDLVLIAARPSMGKTAFVLNIAEYVTMKKGITTAFFSLEMSDMQLANRLLSIESGVDSDKMRKGNLNTNDWERIVDSTDVLADANLIIDVSPEISVSEIRSRCRKYKAENNLGLVIIDYLQLIAPDKTVPSKQQEVSDISRGLKALAREMDVPVVALSQLSRAPELRQEHRPMLSDLRESGAIEQDADVVMFIYRDEKYNPDTEEKGVAEINIAKHRNGPLKTVKLAWIPEQTRFANLELRKGNV